MMNYGIRKVSMIVWARSLIFFHNPGMLTSARQRDFIDINLGRKFNIALDYEVFHMLEYGGGECNHDLNYDLDLCAHNDLHQVSSNSSNPSVNREVFLYECFGVTIPV